VLPLASSATAKEPPALFKAAAGGDEAQVRRLLKAKKDPNEAADHALTPLIISAYAGRVGVVKLLLTAAAEVVPSTALWR
jgi:hypothetical protein